MAERDKRELLKEIAELRRRLAEAEQVVQGIQRGEVDAIVVPGPGRDKVYTLEGAHRSYRVLVEAMGEGAVTLLPDGTVLYANRRFAALVETPLEKITGQPLERFVAAADRRRLAEHLAEGMETNCAGEFTLLGADGKPIPAQFSLVPLELSGGRAICMVVTDLRAVIAARQARLNLAAIVESSDDAIISADLEGKIVSWNAGAERMLGFRASEVIGRSLALVIPHDRSQEMAMLDEVTKAGGTALHMETVRLRKSGTRVDVSVAISPLQDASGRVIGTSRILSDISERKQAERRFREILEAAPDAMLVLNREGKITIVNARVKELFGYEVDDLVGKPHEVLVPERFRARHAQASADFFRAPYARPMGSGLELCGLHKNGREFPVEISLSPLATAGGPLIIAAVRDVSARKQAEEEIRRLSGRLLKAQEDERRRLSYELHDTTAQQLAAITINLGTLQATANLSGQARTCLETAVELARECTEDIRNISHLLHPPLLDEAGLAAALAWYVDRFQRRTKIAVALEVSPDLTPLPKETEIALFRIVQEGLTNVFRHSGSPWAKIELVPNSGGVVLQVVDKGKGMAASAAARASGLSTPGVGISSMRERVRQLGGQFEIASDQKGTTVRVTLPRPGK